MDRVYGRRKLRAQKRLRRGRAFLFLLFFCLFIYGLYRGWAAADWLFFSKTDPAGVTWPRNKEKDQSLLDKRLNVLVLGLDEQAGAAARRSDSMFFVSFDLEKKGVQVLSIPRDTKAAIAGREEEEKINHAYAYGGAALARQAVADLLSVPVNAHVVLDAGGFVHLVDILGGVGVYVENNMKYSDPYQNLYIDIPKGYQKLSGVQALKYIRFRNDELGDIGRVLRQQTFLKALAGELFSWGSILKAPYFKKAVDTGISTDITAPQAVGALRSFKGRGAEGVMFEMLPGAFLTVEGVSYWVSEPKEVASVLNVFSIKQIK